ncbi:tyrosine-type recombinase/integrase, partial [Alkalibacterium sp. s-m-22]
PIIYKQLSIEPLLILKNIKTPKHNRLPSTYTPQEIHSVLNSVDRDTKWGKTIYLMMMFASVYGLRVSDIRDLQLSAINWQDKILSLSQQKTQTPLNLPLIYEIELALLDYIKNVRPS